MALLRGFGAEEAKAAFARAQELAGPAGPISERAATYYGVWVGHLVRAELAAARARGEAFVAEMRPGGPSALLATAHRCVGMTAWLQGDYGPAREHNQAALDLSDAERDREGRKIFGQDTSVAAGIYLAHSIWLTGHVAQARELAERQLRSADATQHLPTQVNAIDQVAILAIAAGDYATARPLAVRLLQLSDGPGLTLYSSSAKMILACCDGLEHGAAGVIDRLREAIAEYTAPGSKILFPLYTGLLAEFEVDGPAPDRALASMDEALAFSRLSGELWTDPVLHRIRGDILLKRGHQADAERAYLAALEIARAQSSCCFGLQAALALARIYGQPRAREASNRLAAALEAFPAGAEWRQIDEARALMESLARAA